MNRKEKFKQANREANATWLALLIVIVFWCVAGFGLADVKVEFFHCIFKDMDLDDKEDEING